MGKSHKHLGNFGGSHADLALRLSAYLTKNLSVFREDQVYRPAMFPFSCFSSKKSDAKDQPYEKTEPKEPTADPQIVHQLMQILPHATIGGLILNNCGELIEIKVNGKKFYAMISTATTLSFCHPGLIQTLNLQEFKVDDLNIPDTYGETCNFSGYCKVSLELGQIFVDDIEILVSSNNMGFHLMIGMDVLSVIAKKYRYDFGFSLDHFKFGPYVFPKLRVNFSDIQ